MQVKVVNDGSILKDMWELKCGYHSDSEPGSENYSLNYTSLSPTAPLVSPEGSLIGAFIEELTATTPATDVLTPIFNKVSTQCTQTSPSVKPDQVSLPEELIMTVVLKNGALQVRD